MNDADIAVRVEFQAAAVEKVDGKTVSSVKPGTVDNDGTSEVKIQVQDSNEVGLNGFITLTIDDSAGASVLFESPDPVRKPFARR